jgi:hypothetical protein
MGKEGADLLDDLGPPSEERLQDRGLLGDFRGHQASLQWITASRNDARR